MRRRDRGAKKKVENENSNFFDISEKSKAS